MLVVEADVQDAQPFLEILMRSRAMFKRATDNLNTQVDNLTNIADRLPVDSAERRDLESTVLILRQLFELE